MSGTQQFQAVVPCSVYRVADPDPYQDRPRSIIIDNDILYLKYEFQVFGIFILLSILSYILLLIAKTLKVLHVDDNLCNDIGQLNQPR